MEIRDVLWIEVAEVSIELGGGRLGAGLVEGGFGEGVVHGAEVEVDPLTLADALEVGWDESQLLVGADCDGDDGGSGRVDLSRGDDEGAGCFGGGQGCRGGKGGEAEESGDGGELHVDGDVV